MHCHFMVNSLKNLWFICGSAKHGSVAGLNLWSEASDARTSPQDPIPAVQPAATSCYQNQPSISRSSCRELQYGAMIISESVWYGQWSIGFNWIIWRMLDEHGWTTWDMAHWSTSAGNIWKLQDLQSNFFTCSHCLRRLYFPSFHVCSKLWQYSFTTILNHFRFLKLNSRFTLNQDKPQ